LQTFVAINMAKLVVEVFEIIHVNEDQTNRLVAHNAFIQLFFKIITIRQTR
jgi:hypothetical protein